MGKRAGSGASGALHVGVDAWNLPVDRRGIGRYTREIIRRWIEDRSRRVRVTLVVPELLTWIAGERYRRELDGGTIAVRTRASAERCRFDALWFPWNGMSWTCRGVKIATLHDAVYFASPAPEAKIRAHEQKPLVAAAKLAAHIITDSHFSKGELVRYLGVEPHRVDVVPLGVDMSMADAAAASHEPAARFGGCSRYVLFVGEVEARKGIDVLIEAMKRLPQSLRADTALVIAGRWQSMPSDLASAGTRIFALGAVSDERLAALYAGAAAFAFPSTYEGFGLPVLEAMAFGTPVIASDAASIPEAGGDAAFYVPAGDAGALAAAIERVLTHDGLAADLRARGKLRAAEQTWDLVAARTLAVFERVVDGSRSAH